MLLQVTDLQAGYGKKQVIHGISLEVREREIVAVLGHNGAGKSTLMNAIFGVIRPTGGSVLFQGRDITGHRPSANVQEGLGYSPQGGEVFRTMTVTENLMLGGFPVEDQGLVAERIARVQELFPALYERRNTRAGSLSGGERQMLALGAVLVSSPRMVILDEPSGGLSPIMVDNMYEAIRDVAARLNAAVLLVEQESSHALEIADRAYVLANGRLIHQSDAKELARSEEELGRLLLGL
jgi:branched-chain amino acid transport system ATP-binding protein